METYSGKTRVELTARGWAYVASRELEQTLAAENEVTKSKLEEAARAIRSASELLGNPLPRENRQRRS